MDRLTKKQRSWNMSRIRPKNTTPEIKLRKVLFLNGFRYRINYNILGKPDIAFPKAKIAIFIHGCFWHRHGCENSVVPKTNRSFWLKKFNSNTKRDILVEKFLKKEKWKVIIIWECELDNNFNKVTSKLIHLLKPKLKRNL
jgi:DNA mismatch endonuclease (patch repair protein)